MNPERYSELIRALNQAGIDAFGADPIVPYEELITREDALFCHTLKIRLDDPGDMGMKKIAIAVLFLNLTANADAQGFRWKNWKHHILCMCIGTKPVLTSGN